MQLRKITVDNFKSLVGFELDLAKFTCLIGLNGAGKSTVLQFIDFLAQLVRGDIEQWLRDRQWKASELLCKLRPTKRIINFSAILVDDDESEIVWTGAFHPPYGRLTLETVRAPTVALQVESGKFTITGDEPFNPISERIAFTYQGSILSQLQPKVLPGALKRLREFFLETESLDMLSPERLRQRTRTADGSLGRGGRQLSAFVDELGLARRKQLSTMLKKAYRQFSGLYSKSLRSGWKELLAT